MQNNFDLIRSMLSFEDEYDFYFVQILKRRKDNPGMDKPQAVIRSYYVDSFEYFDDKVNTWIDYANKYNARVTIRLNKRSYKNVTTKLLIEIAKRIDENNFKNIHSAYDSVAGKYSSDKDKKWIVDVDKDDLKNISLGELCDFINTLREDNKVVKAIIPSNSGVHIITKGFNPNDFKKKFPKIEIKKDSFTNLYIP
jgi:hypothetical protein